MKRKPTDRKCQNSHLDGKVILAVGGIVAVFVIAAWLANSLATSFGSTSPSLTDNGSNLAGDVVTSTPARLDFYTNTNTVEEAIPSGWTVIESDDSERNPYERIQIAADEQGQRYAVYSQKRCGPDRFLFGMWAIRCTWSHHFAPISSGQTLYQLYPTLDPNFDWEESPDLPDLPDEGEGGEEDGDDGQDEDEVEDLDTQYTEQGIWCQVAPSSFMCKFAANLQKAAKFFLDRIKTILSGAVGWAAGFTSNVLGKFQVAADNLRESVRPILEGIYDYISSTFGIEGEVVEDPNSNPSGSRVEIAGRAMLNYLHSRNVLGLSLEAALSDATVQYAFEVGVIELDLEDRRLKYIPYQPEDMPTVYYATSGPYEFVGPWEYIEQDFEIVREYNFEHLQITLDPPVKEEATVVDIQCPVMDWRENFESYDGVPLYVFKYETVVYGSCSRHIDYFTGVGTQMHEFVDRAEPYFDQWNLSRHLFWYISDRPDLDRSTTGRWIRYNGWSVNEVRDVVLSDKFLENPSDIVVRHGDTVRFIVDEADKVVQLVSFPIRRFMPDGNREPVELESAAQYGFEPIAAWLYGGERSARPRYQVDGIDIVPVKKVYSCIIDSVYDHQLYLLVVANDGRGTLTLPLGQPQKGDDLIYIVQEQSAKLPRS